MKYHIYKILCIVNNKTYIGKSQEYKKRWRSHKNQLRLGTHNNYYLQRDWIVYGEDKFVFELLSEFTNSDECNHEEIKLINEFEDCLLYNIVKDISVGGDYFTHNPRKEEIRQKLSKARKGEKNHQFGKKKTEKMINSVKEANSKPVIINNVDYPSATEASRILNLNTSTVLYRLKSNSHKFTEWNYKNA